MENDIIIKHMLDIPLALKIKLITEHQIRKAKGENVKLNDIIIEKIVFYYKNEHNI